jgi:WD40 repeat protein
LWQLDKAVSRPVIIATESKIGKMEFAQKSDYLAVESGEKIRVFDLMNIYSNGLRTRARRLAKALQEKYTATTDKEDNRRLYSISPDGKWIATVGITFGDGSIHVRSVQGGELKIFKGHRYNVTSVSFSPDSRWMATSSRDRTVRIWSLESNQMQEINYINPVEKVVFSPEGNRITSATGPSIQISFVATGQAKTLLQEAERNNGVYPR